MGKRTNVTNNIRALRFANGEITQAQLADRIDVTRQTIIAIEQGRYSPSLEMAFQIAKILGAEVTGVCGPAKTDLVAALGADHVVDYTRSDFGAGEPFDAIIDTAGHRPLRVRHRALTPRGTAVIVGSETGGR